MRNEGTLLQHMDERRLKDTTFVCMEPLAEKFRTGILGPWGWVKVSLEKREFHM